MKKNILFAVCCLLTACSADYPAVPDSLPDRYVSFESERGRLYWNRIQPILDKRCIVCHGCYDAPCQANLTSAQGIERGANKQVIYDGTRLTADPLTRLFEDAHTLREWREKNFYPLLNEDPEKNPLQNSLFYRMLKLKKNNPLDDVVEHNTRLPADLFDFSLNPEYICPDIDQFEEYAESHPHWGMPYGLPPLEQSELKLLKNWLQIGAPLTTLPELDTVYQEQIRIWEAFLNGDTTKQRLVARYIYEHLFLGHLYFDDLERNNSKIQAFFKIVRSRTPPGEPISIISTRRPYDDPEVDRVFYRLQRVAGSVVAKSHLPYALNDKRLQRFDALFFKTSYNVKELPDYRPELASNPFETFTDIPANVRYRFMLEHAKFTINGFIKGAVCRGQVALNVINDHFWVFFVNPDQEALAGIDRFLNKHSRQLKIPPERESNASIISHWTEYSNLQAAYLKEKSARLNELLEERKTGFDLDWVWDGDGQNWNAALTVFRHFDSATVVEGLVGQPPKTAWLIDYPILERIHYLLVAGFDVYGNAGHQLSTRLYMDFLRMESEFNFLALLPEDTRTALREHWYRGAKDRVKQYVYGHAQLNAEPEIAYPDDKPAKQYLYDRLQHKLSDILSKRYDLDNDAIPEWHRSMLKKLHGLKGKAMSILPEMGLLTVVERNRQNRVYTILRNSAHTHITSLLFEQNNRVPEEDYITVLPGFVGGYPDALWQVEFGLLEDFVKQASQLENEDDYYRLMNEYGIRRSHTQFWQFSDQLHENFQMFDPVEYGSLDYNRIENR
ncbi:Fatty acid cis/trans isomerase (CTI) [Nitrosomonas sp. Nm51]|uniref:fatty acid cis/trans isomerase n=1 Tax=Nitrosomonas sp. Nm51 TaxID=133720 RepID=UPI0008CB81E1|nr:fatty acid cis/trans isomerase [Nitrosomonas sp. Nm51]SER50506.1 Fatty acid cis/trans isomerase (CTI) [Nitrosomonas sp. Nm51]